MKPPRTTHRSPVPRLAPAAMFAIVWLALVVSPAAAQSTTGDCSCSPAWQIVGAVALGAFVSAIVALFLTRWRGLFGGKGA